METKQAKLKPFHIIIIVVMAVLTVALYLNKDRIIPNPNAAYEELYSTFLQAEGTIVSSENTGGRRSRVIYTIQFSDQNGNPVTIREDNWQTMPLKTGEKVIIYYNPQNSGEALPESRWKEIMGK
jgi:hypothetical protein